MPLAAFSRQKALKASVGLLLGRGRGSSVSIQAQRLSSLGSTVGRPVPAEEPVIGAIHRNFSNYSVPAAAARQTGNAFGRNMMPASGCLSNGAGLGSHNAGDLGLRGGKLLRTEMGGDLRFRSKDLVSCRRATSGVKSREPLGGNMISRCFSSSATGRSWKPEIFTGPMVKGFRSSWSGLFSAGTAPDVSFDGILREDRLESSVPSSNQKLPGDRALKLLSGSCYLPHPDKEETGGEDAHFICVEEQAIGVADGVGGWAELGIDAGQYARELMCHSEAAIQEEPKGSVDPARVLEKAYRSTKAKGSSTACIIALTDRGVHAVNLGDSGFIIVRDGCIIFRSPVQQHDFNFTYQLEYGNCSDLPSAAQVFAVPVAAGDVIVAGTDGLFDNLYNNEVTAVVVHGIRAGLVPQATSQKIAALARQRALDKNRQTPFSTAAQDAGYRYYGGKLDDITVVVSYVSTSST